MPVEPIKHEFVVRCTTTRSFDIYVNHIGQWWDPMYTTDANTCVDVTIEPKLGGMVYETHRDGRCVVWGEVTQWSADQGLSYTSALSQDPEHPSQITVGFTAHPQGCQVNFAHGGWTDRNKACRAKFTAWQAILNRYIACAEGR